MSTSYKNRPLSPHLSVYKPQITSVMSIMHRMTGVALSFGSIIIVAWLWAAAYAPHWYERLHECLSSIVGQVLLAGWTFAFYYHLFNGIRHLMWDTGAGLEIHKVTRSGIIALIATLAMTAATWTCVLLRAPGAAL